MAGKPSKAARKARRAKDPQVQARARMADQEREIARQRASQRKAEAEALVAGVRLHVDAVPAAPRA